MKAYSMDLRERVIGDCDAGMPTKQVALKYQVSPAWVRRLKQRRRERGDIQPRPGGHRPRQIDRQQLAALVAQQPDATLAQLQQRLGLTCSLAAICLVLQELKLTFKKSPCTPPSRTGRM
jgi:transposase